MNNHPSNYQNYNNYGYNNAQYPRVQPSSWTVHNNQGNNQNYNNNQ